jgi:hypothetical protein
MAADRNLQPTDLKKYGYVEEEFIATGTANVYDWAADGALTVKTPGVPYGTRILARRPADSGRFSGDVIVESLTPRAVLTGPGFGVSRTMASFSTATRGSESRCPPVRPR